jgi:hypothetical protein
MAGKAVGNPGEPQAIEVLARRHRELETRRIQAERDVEHYAKLLEEEKGRARAQFGTDDLAELEAMLARMREENLRRRREYEAHLDEIEASLQAIEAAHAEARRA